MTAEGIQTVLVIDDDPDVLALAEVALSDLGNLTTVLCENMEDALVRVEEIPPDAILLDLFLGDSDAFKVLGRLRAKATSRHTPVIIITAQLDEAALAGLEDLGVCGVIKKPFEPKTLCTRVRHMCG